MFGFDDMWQNIGPLMQRTDPYNPVDQALGKIDSAAALAPAPTTTYQPQPAVDSQRISPSGELIPYSLESTFTGADIRAMIVTKSDVEAGYYMFDQMVQMIAASGVSSLPSTMSSLTANRTANGPGFPLVNLSSITVSTYRAKAQVRALGYVNPKGIARGSRTIAGTMILTEMDRESFWNLLTKNIPENEGSTGDAMNAVLIDQVAPFNVVLLFGNEYGKAAYRYLYDVEIVSNGVVYSIHDMFSEGTLSFMASDVTPLTPIAGLTSANHPKVSLLTQMNSASELTRRFRANLGSYNSQL